MSCLDLGMWCHGKHPIIPPWLLGVVLQVHHYLTNSLYQEHNTDMLGEWKG